VGLLGIVIGVQIIPTGRQLLASTTLPFAKTQLVQTHTTHLPLRLTLN
jgi:xanthosine utilization system XapX-like protein